MIRYSLSCDAGHSFDGWFQGFDGFEDQLNRGLVACPHCQSARVTKAIMAPSVVRTDFARREEPSRADRASRDAPTGNVTVSPHKPSPSAVPTALLSAETQAQRAAMTALRTLMLSNAENVGSQFATEARAMHHGEIEERSIYGQASSDDVKQLIEDGINVLPIPVLPEDRN
jgi:hypothetical protein